MMKDDEELGLYEEETKCYCGHTTYCDCGPKQHVDFINSNIDEFDKAFKLYKQETLEEAAIIHAHKSFVWPLNKQGEKQSIPPGQIVPPGYAKHQKIANKHFIAGAKWQQERSYSEEEVLNKLTHFAVEIQRQNKKGVFPLRIKEWFEINKKK